MLGCMRTDQYSTHRVIRDVVPPKALFMNLPYRIRLLTKLIERADVLHHIITYPNHVL